MSRLSKDGPTAQFLRREFHGPIYHYCPRCRMSTRSVERLVEQAPRPICVACNTEGVYVTLDELNLSAGELENLVKERLNVSKTKEAPPVEGETRALDVVAQDAREIVRLWPKDLVPSPTNPRGPVAEKDVEDLTPIIETFGQKVPATVRPKGDRHEIVLGQLQDVFALVDEDDEEQPAKKAKKPAKAGV